MGVAASRPTSYGYNVSVAPRTWLLESEKLGDNAQLQVVATALGWPYETRRIAVRPRYRLGKPWVRASLHHVDLARSSALEPPWPELVLCSGRRMSMVGLWIKQQSGDGAKLVLLGKPRRLADRFDLVVAALQYRLPQRDNILRITLPLMRVDRAKIGEAAAAWTERIAEMPRPLTAVLVGGPARLVRFGARAAERLVEALCALQARQGGSLWVVTSRRTPRVVVETLARALPRPSRLHRFDAEGENPYDALLASADRFVVTADSLSMLTEVARLGRPLAVFSLPPSLWSWGGDWRGTRDLAALPRLLCAQGLAVPLGQPFRAPAAMPPDELAAVVERIRALVPVT